jgi:plastocyanin
MLQSRTRLLLAAALVVGLALGATACGDDGDDTGSGPGTSTTASGGTTDDAYGSTSGGDGGSSDKPSVVAQGLAFDGDLTVAPGEEFVFDNQSNAPHTLTADDGEFDSGEVAGGSQSDPMAAPDEPGDYGFHCEIHSSMTGTLTVEG